VTDTTRTGSPARDAHLLLILGGGGMSGPDAIAAARQAGDVSVIHVAAWGQLPAEALVRDITDHGGTVTVVDTLDDVLPAARKLHSARPVNGAITFSEFLLAPHAQVTADLGLPGNSLESVAIAQSKSRQRLALEAARIRTPRFRVLHDAAGLADAAKYVGFPAVLKPEHGAASIGVLAVTGPEDLRPAWDAAHRLPSPFIEGPGSAWVLEQRLIGVPPADGLADYSSVESLLVDGQPHHLGVCDRLAQRHGFVEEGAIFPSSCDPATVAALYSEADRAIRACGLRSGAVHTELKHTPGGPTVLEINARLGGPMGHLFRLASDTDLAAETARVAVGAPARLSAARPTGAAVARFVPVPGGGAHRLVRAASPADLLASHPELVYARYRVQPGQVLGDKHQHVLSFMVTAPDLQAALAAVAAVEADLDLLLVPVQEAPA
jgi:biotin carboxylase